MAAATDSSPPSAVTASSVTHSPRLRRNSRDHPSSTLSHVLRAESAAAAAAAPILSSDFLDRFPSGSAAVVAGMAIPAGSTNVAVELRAGDDNAAGVSKEKKPAWSTPSNVLVEIVPVIDADSWPALSEAARPSPKSLPADPMKLPSNGSVHIASVPVMSNQPPKHLVANNLNPNLSFNHMSPNRKKTIKRGDGGGGSTVVPGSRNNGKLANGGSVPPSLPISAEMPQTAASIRPAVELPNRNNGTWEQGPRAGPVFGHGMNEHRPPGGNHRRGNNGGGSHHNSYGVRCEQDRAFSDWNSHRNFSGRDSPMQPHHRPFHRPFLRPPPPLPPVANFIGPPGIRPFMNPVVFPEPPPHLCYIQPPTLPPFVESLRGIPPFLPPPPPPPPMLYPAPDPQLRDMILHQIEYYFSPQNLCNDNYLKLNMDEEGWVPITLIANFNRVKKLTGDIRFIMDAVWNSSIVELQGDKIRKRNDWKAWLTSPHTNPYPDVSDTAFVTRSSALAEHDKLAIRMSSMSVQEGSTSENNSWTAETFSVGGIELHGSLVGSDQPT